MHSATKGLGFLIYDRGRKVNSKHNLVPSSFVTLPMKRTTELAAIHPRRLRLLAAPQGSLWCPAAPACVSMDTRRAAASQRLPMTPRFLLLSSCFSHSDPVRPAFQSDPAHAPSLGRCGPGSTAIWAQYTTRVWIPPPQSPACLWCWGSCWSGSRDTWQAFHSEVLQANLRE